MLGTSIYNICKQQIIKVFINYVKQNLNELFVIFKSSLAKFWKIYYAQLRAQYTEIKMQKIDNVLEGPILCSTDTQSLHVLYAAVTSLQL